MRASTGACATTAELYFLEANPNPEIARFEEFASAAEAAGLAYEALIQRLVSLGLARAGLANRLTE